MYAGNPGDVKKRHDKSHIEIVMIEPEELEIKVIHMDHRGAGEKLPVLYASIPVRELIVKGTF